MVVICSNDLILKIKLENMIMKIVETALCEGFKSSNVLDLLELFFQKEHMRRMRALKIHYEKVLFFIFGST